MFGYSLGFVLIVSSLFLLLYNYLENEIKKTYNANCNLESSINHLTQAIKYKNNIIYALNREELYNRMDEFVQNSKKRINLMYMGSKPPIECGSFPSKEKYMENLEKRIFSNNLPIRRIILYSKKNKHWIKDLSQTYIGKNISLYVITNSKYAIHSSQISVQLFDDSKVVLMNFENSDVSMEVRDIIIDSLELNLIFESYYERFIATGVAIPIIENGKLDEKNYNEWFGTK